MYHPARCHCPPKPPPGESVLLPKIIAHEKRSFPHLCTELKLTSLPSCICPPFRLQSISPSTLQPTWHRSGNHDCCSRSNVCISIPVTVCLCDASGNVHTLSATIDVNTWLPAPCCRCSCGQSLLIVPDVQLLCGEHASCDECFPIEVHLSLDIWLLRLEAYQMRRPTCPQLPLYPPPMC